MKSIESCLGYMNRLHYPPQIADEIIKKNCSANHIKVPENLKNLRFMSTYQYYKNQELKIKSPVQGGDVGILLTDNNAKPLALTSFNINPQNEFFDIIQIQGTSFKYLKGKERTILNYLYWRESLINVVENCAKWCEIKALRLIKSDYVNSAENKNKMQLTYDITALNKKFLYYGGKWWIKILRET